MKGGGGAFINPFFYEGNLSLWNGMMKSIYYGMDWDVINPISYGGMNPICNRRSKISGTCFTKKLNPLEILCHTDEFAT